MIKNRIVHHPILGKLEDRKKIRFSFDGKAYEAYEGDTIASALLANGIRTLRYHEESGNPRGVYCNIGHCFECRVTVDQVTNIRACLTPVKNDMTVESGQQQPAPLHPDNESFPRTYKEYLEQKEGE